MCGVVHISFPKVIRANQIKAALTKFSRKLRPPAYYQVSPSLCLWRYDDVLFEIPTFGKSDVWCGVGARQGNVCGMELMSSSPHVAMQMLKRKYRGRVGGRLKIDDKGTVIFIFGKRLRAYFFFEIPGEKIMQKKKL